MTAVLAIDLATDPVVRSFFQDIVKQGGVAKDAEEFILHKPEFPIPITMACALVTGTKVILRYTQMEEGDMGRYDSFIAAIWRLLGTDIRDRRRDEGTQIALMNTVFVGAGQSLERILDARQLVPIDNRIPLSQTTVLGAASSSEPRATLGEFKSCLRHASHFTQTARDLNPATAWQLDVYSEDLKA